MDVGSMAEWAAVVVPVVVALASALSATRSRRAAKNSAQDAADSAAEAAELERRAVRAQERMAEAAEAALPAGPWSLFLDQGATYLLMNCMRDPARDVTLSFIPAYDDLVRDGGPFPSIAGGASEGFFLMTAHGRGRPMVRVEWLDTIGNAHTWETRLPANDL